jgi:PAS domain S-box-containing protein
MQNAIEQAKSILYAAQQEKEKAQRFSTIIDFVHDGIIAVDAAGCITVFNTAAQEITGFSRQEALGRKITDIIPDTRLLKVLETARPELGDIQRLDEQTVIATNRIPVVVDGQVRGAVATYQDISEVQRLEQAIRIRLSEKGFVAQYQFADIVHQSAAIADCIRTAQKFARYDTSVLICGPSGVGKELFAQGIHNASGRRNSPFVAINCAALPEALIESELFGYVEGSFTGAAKKGKAGLFEMAHGGTIFLDEISELPLVLQGRLLRVLQEKQVMRIGDNKLVPVDVRVVCATNRDLRNLVSHQQFRSDLYFRVAILSLHIPALNERSEDIELLAAHFVEAFGYRYRKGRMTLSAEAIAYLREYDYEGNVRELQGMIERAVVVCEGKAIGRDDLAAGNRTGPVRTPAGEIAFPVGQSLREVEDWYIRQVYREAKGSVKECSAILGIDRTTLWRRIKEIPLAF